MYFSLINSAYYKNIKRNIRDHRTNHRRFGVIPKKRMLFDFILIISWICQTNQLEPILFIFNDMYAAAIRLNVCLKDIPITVVIFEIHEKYSH